MDGADKQYPAEKETYIYEKRPIPSEKETYVHEKRPIYMERDV